MNDKLQRAKAADLVTLPDNVEGTNCGNCKFVKDGHCHNPKVAQKVTPRMCCALWDAVGTRRAWESKPAQESRFVNTSMDTTDLRRRAGLRPIKESTEQDIAEAIRDLEEALAMVKQGRYMEAVDAAENAIEALRPSAHEEKIRAFRANLGLPPPGSV